MVEEFEEEKKGLEKKLEEALSSMSDKDRRALLKSLGGVDKSAITKHRHHYPKNHAKFGYVSDTHIGQKAFKEELWVEAMRTFKREGIDTVYHVGDILEGMSGRPGHIYELAQIGFDAQIGYATELIKAFPDVHIFGIDGNHDEWYQGKGDAGVIVGHELEARCANFHHLGQMEAAVDFAPNVQLYLFHGRDGTAYAVSYKMQKLMESFTGGEKPSIILSGHYHKHLTMWNRNIFGVEAGTLCGQTPFMRGKKIPAHMGFGLMDVWYNSKGVKRIDHTFIPHFK